MFESVVALGAYFGHLFPSAFLLLLPAEFKALSPDSIICGRLPWVQPFLFGIIV